MSYSNWLYIESQIILKLMEVDDKPTSYKHISLWESIKYGPL